MSRNDQQLSQESKEPGHRGGGMHLACPKLVSQLIGASSRVARAMCVRLAPVELDDLCRARRCDPSPAPKKSVEAGNGGSGGGGGNGGSPVLANVGMSYPCAVSTGGGGGGGASTVSDAGQPDAAADRSPFTQPTCVVGQSYCNVLQLKPQGSQPGLSLGGCRPFTDGDACAANPTCDCLLAGSVASPPECSCNETQPGFATVICQQTS